MPLTIKIFKLFSILYIVSWMNVNHRLVAQATIPMYGYVYNEDGAPITGAEVTYITRVKLHTISDTTGAFSLQIPDTAGFLQVHFPGLEGIYVPIRSTNKSINIILKKKAIHLGYGTANQDKLVGAIAQIEGSQLITLPIQHSLYALQSWSSGADIVQSSDHPGAQPTVVIRGHRSFSGENEPLYVVDGVPLAAGVGLDGFNTEDIASITILKDAAACAVYGLRAANGVILINTRKGRSQAGGWRYHAYYGVTQPQVRTQMMNGAEFAEYRREAHRSRRSYSTPFPNPTQDFELFRANWAAVAQAYEWTDEANLIPKYRPATAEEKAYYGQWNLGTVDQIPVYNPSKVGTTDWGNLALRTGQKHNHHLSYSSNTRNYAISLALGYYNETGVQLTQDFERLTGHFSVDYSGSKKLHWGLQLNTALNDQNWGADIYENALNQNPLASPFNPDGSIAINPDLNTFHFNPLLSIDGEVDNRKLQRLLGSIYAEVQLGKAWSYRLNLGSDWLAQQNGLFQAANTQPRRGGYNYATYDRGTRANYLYESIINYNKLFQAGHQLELTFLHSLQYHEWRGKTLSAIDLPEASQYYRFLKTNQASSYINSSGSFKARNKWDAGLLRAHYSHANKYLFSVTVRYDNPAHVPTEEQHKIHWALALGWNLHEETFLQEANWINTLKIRASYGHLGHPGTGYLATKDGFSTDYHQSKQQNLGLDFTLLKQRITGNIDFYMIRSSPQVKKLFMIMPPDPNITVIRNEIGYIQNQGFELQLQSLNAQGRHWRWSTQWVLNVNREKVKLPPDKPNINYATNHPVTTYFGWKPIGVWSTEEATLAQQYGFSPGKVKYADINGDFKIDLQDRVILGSNVPNYNGSISNVVALKNWEFSLLLYARIGQSSLSRYYSPRLNGEMNEAQFIAGQYWTPARQAQARYPQPGVYNYIEGAYYTQKASFAKVRSLTLQYRFNREQLSRMKLNQLTVYTSLYNPFLISAFKLTDPEFYDPKLSSAFQADNLNPGEKALILGIRLAF